MIDYRTLHPAVQATIENNLRSTAQQIMQSGTENVKELANKTCDLFQQYAIVDQVLCCALILGMVWAEIESGTSEYEINHAMVASMKDRRAMFDSLCEVIYQETMASAKAAAALAPPNRQCN